MQSLFPSSTSIETSTPEEFQSVKDTKEVKQSPSKRTYRIKRILEPSEEYSYSINEIQTRQKTRALNKRRRKFLELEHQDTEEPVLYTPTGHINLEIDIMKKKIHKDEEERSVQSTDDSSVGHHKISNLFLDPNECLNEEHILEDQAHEIEPLIKRMEGNPDSLDFLWEDSLGPVWEVEDRQEYVPKKIRNFGLENSINPIFWEYDQNSINFDLM
jgi:hypothetical protein